MDIQGIRNLMRPFLTVWSTSLYAFVVIYGLTTNAINFTEALAACSVPLGSIYTYHFLKSSKVDEASN